MPVGPVQPAATITASSNPTSGTLSYLIDGTPNMTQWQTPTLPFTLTLEFSTEQSYYRDFTLWFYPGYTPKDFTVDFYKADGTLSGAQVVVTNFPQYQPSYVCQEARSRYNTKKIVVTVTSLNHTSNLLAIVEACWAYYSSNPGMFPSYLHRGSGGAIYGNVNFQSGLSHCPATNTMAVFDIFPTGGAGSAFRFSTTGTASAQMTYNGATSRAYEWWDDLTYTKCLLRANSGGDVEAPSGAFKGGHKSADGTAGLTATKTFYTAPASGGGATILNTVTMKNGIVTAWDQA